MMVNSKIIDNFVVYSSAETKMGCLAKAVLLSMLVLIFCSAFVKLLLLYIYMKHLHIFIKLGLVSYMYALLYLFQPSVLFLL